jgi:molybdopterin synthase sulfur carrier subunit
MPTVFLPPPLRRLAGGHAVVAIDGETVGDLVDALESRYPGIRARLCDGDRLRPGLNVAVNSEFSDLGLLQRVPPDSEVHFLPAVGGG